MVSIDGHGLAINDLVQVARHQEFVEISKAGIENVQHSRSNLEAILKTDNPVYGINTGFGIFAEQRIPRKDSDKLSRNLILSHAVATGAALPEEVTRAAMLVRANTLVKGYSGVRQELVQTLVDMLNKGVTPVIPEQGSLGSSGDLSPLSHLALVFTTDADDRLEDSGWAKFNGNIMRGKDAMDAAGITRIVLGPKEGLATINGATFSAAIGALAVEDAHQLLIIANHALAMSLEAMMGCSSAYDPRLHRARGQRGQIHIADAVLQLIEGSTFVDGAHRVQDAYSLRCAPQVHGAAVDTLAFVESVIQAEINAATDNPLIFDPGIAISGGNFHGEPVGLVMDFLGIALAELGAISERRTFRLTDGNLNTNLPPMLVDCPEAAGLNSGLMMPQYTAASLVLENQTLAHPDSVHSLPTSGEQEDHNANAMTASRHARQIVSNVRHVLAIELYTAARAIDLRMRQNPGARLGIGTQKIYNKIRGAVPYQPGDALWGREIDAVRCLLESGELG